MFLDKNLNFCQDFLPNFDFFCKFVKKYKLQFIYVLMSFLFVSSYVSICILLKFMYSKFQLSNSKIWLIYEYSNMPHLLVNTLYFLKWKEYLFASYSYIRWKGNLFLENITSCLAVHFLETLGFIFAYSHVKRWQAPSQAFYCAGLD